MLAQWADAMTFVAGMLVIEPIEWSPVAAFGPGWTLMAKAAGMLALVLTRRRWGWRIAGIAALVVGAVGASANLLVIVEVAW
jgi:hypothetical protein